MHKPLPDLIQPILDLPVALVSQIKTEKEEGSPALAPARAEMTSSRLFRCLSSSSAHGEPLGGPLGGPLGLGAGLEALDGGLEGLELRAGLLI